MRRLNKRYDPIGPRSAKVILQKLLSIQPVQVASLRKATERFEEQFSEYSFRSKSQLSEYIRMVILEHMLAEPLKTHRSVNSDRLSIYELLRAEIPKYAEITGQDNLGNEGLRETRAILVDALTMKGDKGKCKHKGRWKGT